MGTIAKAIVFILLACSCFGQGHKRALIAPRPSGAELDPMTFGIAHRWIWTNNTVSPIAAWKPFVGTNELWQTAAEKPGLATNGIVFSQFFGFYLQVSDLLFNMYGGTNDAINVVLCFTNATYSDGPVVGSGPGTQPLVGGRKTGQYWMTRFNLDWGHYEFDRWYDFGISQGATVNDVQFWTNGIAGLLTNVASISPYQITFVGKDAPNGWFGGILAEIIHWTNVGRFSANQWKMIHNYCTNMYGVTNTYPFAP